MAGFGRLAAVEVDRRQGASKVENYGRGPWQEGLRNSTLYVTLVALQYKCILAVRADGLHKQYATYYSSVTTAQLETSYLLGQVQAILPKCF